MSAEKQVRGFPSVQNVNKQHLYQLAYKKMIGNNNWDKLIVLDIDNLIVCSPQRIGLQAYEKAV